MATQTKVQKGLVDTSTVLQEAIEALEAQARRVATNISLAEAATANLRESQEALSRVASRLRDLQGETVNGRASRQGERTVSTGRKDVDAPLQAVPRPGASKRRVGAVEGVFSKPISKYAKAFGGDQ